MAIEEFPIPTRTVDISGIEAKQEEHDDRLSALPKTVFVDSAASDSNSGLAPTEAKQTIAAAVALLNTGDTLSLARGSQWFGGGISIEQSYIRVRTHGQGNRPILDGAFSVAGTWVQHGTYTSLWHLDVTFPEATAGSSANLSSAWHPMVWDEAASSRTTEAGLRRVLNGDIVGGATVSQTTINGLLNIANATPGSFTVHKAGSTNHEPRSDNGTTFRFYVHLADGSNPNSNGRTIYTVGQRSVATLGNGTDVHGVAFQRSGAKDMVGAWGGAVQVGEFVDCDFLEAAVHAAVVGGAQFRRCVARACSHGDSRSQGGGAFHNYRAASVVGTSRGFKVYDCEAHGFAQVIYSHGTGGGIEHTTFDVDGLLAVDCGNPVAMGVTQKGSRVRRLKAIRCAMAGMAAGVVYEDSSFIDITGTALCPVLSVRETVTFRRCFIHKASGRLEILDPLALGTVAADDYPTAIFEDSTIIGEVSDPGNAQRRQQNWVLTRTILHRLVERDDMANGVWLSGTITAADSYIGLDKTDLETLRSVKTGIAASCVSNRFKNKFQKEVALSDLLLVPVSSRTATYSGTDNGDGTANLVLNFNDRTYGRHLRVVDAYGAGLHYDGRVVSIGATTSDPVVVAPPPTASFSGKAFQTAVFNRKIWDAAHSETAAVSADGSQIRVADPTLYCVGMLIWVGAVNRRKADFGPRTITAKSGSVLTLSEACPWLSYGDVAINFNSIDGTTTTNRQPLPTVTVGYGFPLNGTTSVGATNLPYPLMTLEAAEGTSGTAKISDSTDKFAAPAGIAGISGSFANRRTDGSSFSYGSFFARAGYIDQGWMVTVGDTLTVEAVAQVDAWEPRLATNPILSLDGSLAADSWLATKGIGYRRQTRVA